jgi:formamidopyrimidine-DNA glycosylase
MPELPEVERAMRRLRKAVEGKTISSARALHPALLRQLPEDKAQLLIERRIISVERRGKHQLLHLDDGSMLHAHFRMNGDWLLSTTDAEPERFTRALIDLSDGTRIELNDRRALSAMSYHAAGEDPLPKLGMEANDPALDAE